MGLPCLTPVLSRPVQMNRPAQAAAAAHTFFVANPGHQEMRQNLEYYQAMAGVREDDFTDLEAKPHLVRPPPPWATPAKAPICCRTWAGHAAAAGLASPSDAALVL